MRWILYLMRYHRRFGRRNRASSTKKPPRSVEKVKEERAAVRSRFLPIFISNRYVRAGARIARPPGWFPSSALGRPSRLSAGRQNPPGGSNSNNAESTWQHWFSDAAPREKTGEGGGVRDVGSVPCTPSSFFRSLNQFSLMTFKRLKNDWFDQGVSALKGYS